MYIFSYPEEKLVFSKGIFGVVNNGKIQLLSGSSVLNTEYTPALKDIIELQERYNIKILGLMNKDIASESNNVLHFQILFPNDQGLFDSVEILRDFSNRLVDLERLIQIKLFGSNEQWYMLQGMIPIAFSAGGLRQDFFFSKEVFVQSYNDSNFDSELKNKIIYYFDLMSLFEGLNTRIVSSCERFLAAEHEMSVTLQTLSKRKALCKNEEFVYYGLFSRRVEYVYVDLIISLHSVLDILTKIGFEITRIPCHFCKPVKMISNKKFFDHIREIDTSLWPELNTCTLFNNANAYKELTFLRNEVVHKSLLSDNIGIYYGKETNEVNNEALEYACCYIWDIEPEGNPSRWVNRSRFFGNQTCIDEYMIKWIEKIVMDSLCALDSFYQVLTRIIEV